MYGCKVLVLTLGISILALCAAFRPVDGEVIVDANQEEKGNYADQQVNKQGLEGLLLGEGAKNGDKKKDLIDLQKLDEWSKLIFRPFDLIKSISSYFNLPLEKVVDKVGRGMITGTEVLLYPLVFSAKIIEKVFVPDNCRLELVCSLGKQLEFAKDTVVKFSPTFLTGSSHLKALSEGIVGQDCSKVFSECEPKLKKEYEELKHV